MIGLGMSALKVYLAVEPCDMCKGFNGLAVAAVEHLAQPLACDSLFVFINKRHSRVKLTEVIKRLPHNATPEQAAELTPARFAAALRGQARQVA